MPWWMAKFNWSMLHLLHRVGAMDELDADIIHRSSAHSQSWASCSIPKLWPISWAIVVATTLMIGLWSVETPPENSYVQIGPLRALPTTPPSNIVLVSSWALSFGWSCTNTLRRYVRKLVKVVSPLGDNSISFSSVQMTTPTSAMNMFNGT